MKEGPGALVGGSNVKSSAKKKMMLDASNSILLDLTAEFLYNLQKQVEGKSLSQEEKDLIQKRVEEFAKISARL